MTLRGTAQQMNKAEAAIRAVLQGDGQAGKAGPNRAQRRAALHKGKKAAVGGGRSKKKQKTTG